MRTLEAAPPALRPDAAGRRRRLLDRALRVTSAAAGGLVLAILLATALFLYARSHPAVAHYGLSSFFRADRWAPSEATATSRAPNPYGVLGFIYGTLLTSGLALAAAVPIAVGVALFVNELAPARLRGALGGLTELLASVPSVVFGFWGLYALVPAMRPVAAAFESFGRIPVLGVALEGPFFGFSYLAASTVLSLMVLPIVAAIARELLATTPRDLKEGAYALGATRWEAIRAVVLPHSRSGLVGAALLGLGRALGETIAVTMLIGNNVLGISKSILGQGATLASVIANEFTEANRPLHLSSLFFVGLVLLGVTLVVNIAGSLVVGRAAPAARR
jgi:phosphate transport system permease protein